MTTPPTYPPPGPNAPSNVTAEVIAPGSPADVRVTWQDNSDDETAFNVRFDNLEAGQPTLTWHADQNTTSVVAKVYAGTYDVTVYAAGWFQSPDPAYPSTNTWSDPSNTVRITVAADSGKGHGHGKNKH